MFILQKEDDPYREPADPLLVIDGDDVIDEEGRANPGFVAGGDLRHAVFGTCTLEIVTNGRRRGVHLLRHLARRVPTLGPRHRLTLDLPELGRPREVARSPDGVSFVVLVNQFRLSFPGV